MLAIAPLDISGNYIVRLLKLNSLTLNFLKKLIEPCEAM